ncbi:MAG: RNA polymerase sigma-70 factor [Spirosomataceae bacterium]
MAFPENMSNEDEKSNFHLLPNTSSDDSDVSHEKGISQNSELFIRREFELDPAKGCSLLFRRYHKVLCSHAVRFVYSKEIAEDLVSEVFCRFWKTKSYESVTTSYRLYLFQCIRNEAFNYLRWEFRETEDISSAHYQESPLEQQPDHATHYEEIFRKVEDLVETLPPQCRKVFLKSRFEGKKYQVIADELGLSIKTVEVHLSKALNIMRFGLKNHL